MLTYFGEKPELDNLFEDLVRDGRMVINPLAPELFFFLISAHSVYKM